MFSGREQAGRLTRGIARGYKYGMEWVIPDCSGFNALCILYPQLVHIFAHEPAHFPPIKALFLLVTSVTLTLFQQGTCAWAPSVLWGCHIENCCSWFQLFRLDYKVCAGGGREHLPQVMAVLVQFLKLLAGTDEDEKLLLRWTLACFSSGISAWVDSSAAISPSSPVLHDWKCALPVSDSRVRAPRGRWSEQSALSRKQESLRSVL